jgi:glycosyltransferase involved in cell wall biosynthesis
MTVQETAVFVAMRSFGLYRSRIPLMEVLLASGWRVVAVCEEDGFSSHLRTAGIEIQPIAFHSRGRSLTHLPGLHRELNQVLSRLGPRLLHVYNAVPLLLCGLPGAAPRATVWINTVTGLGRGSSAGRLRSWLAYQAYQFAIRRADHTVFQNGEDRMAMGAGPKTSTILGSGVDTGAFVPGQRRHVGQQVRFLMVSRLLWSKGVREYAEAARSVKARGRDVEFLLAGEFVEGDPDSVPAGWIESRVAANELSFLGYRDDMAKLLSSVDVLVHPTLYAEGLPRVLLEAGACGLPVIAIDGPGSNEAVLHRRTGLLVRREALVESLSTAMTEFIDDAEFRIACGRAARAHVVAHHDIRTITARYVDLYRSLGIKV